MRDSFDPAEAALIVAVWVFIAGVGAAVGVATWLLLAPRLGLQ